MSAMSEGREACFWRPAPVEAPELACAGLAGGATPHVHEEWQFGVAARPATLAVGAFQHCLVEPGMVAVVPPYQVHTEMGVMGQDTEWRVFTVDHATVSRAWGTLVGVPAAPAFAGPLLIDASAAAELAGLHQASEAGALVGRAMAARFGEWLTRLLGAYAMAAPARGDAPRPIERVRCHLLAHPTETVGLASLSALAGLTTSYLVRSFARVVGLPPLRYQAQLRLARARRLLAQGSPPAWVAYECGFTDQAHLCRRFKEFYDLTPGAFRAQYRTTPVSRLSSTAA
jgi:AraC-like DNA-binding protein